MLAATIKKMTASDFDFFRNSIYEIAGISLSDTKSELVQSRLSSHLMSLGFVGFSEYRRYLESLPLQHEAWQDFVNLLTTNKTDWFRESSHFDYLLQKVLPHLKLKQQPISIWCAASSTGEEPYTLAMVLEAYLGSSYPFKILATDLDTEVIAHAKNGVYSVERMRDQVPVEYQRYFNIGKGTALGWARVDQTLKERVTFEQLNLIETPYSLSSKFDIIFCRNVLIYFDKETINSIAKNFYEIAKPNALLFIGHSETLQAGGTRWSYVIPAIYSKGSKS